MAQPMKPTNFLADRELIERSDRLVRTRPEYEGNRSRFWRKAIREALEREEAEVTQRAEAAA